MKTRVQIAKEVALERIEKQDAIIKALIEALEDAMIQLEYLDEKFEPTGTTASTIAKIERVLRLAKGESK